MKESNEKIGLLWIHKAILLGFADALIILASYLMALLLRFDFIFSYIPPEYIQGYLWSMPFWVTATIVVFYGCRLYHSIWRLASVAELRMILTAYIILAVTYSAGMLFMHLHMPRSYYFMGYIISFCLTTGGAFFLPGNPVLFQKRCAGAGEVRPDHGYWGRKRGADADQGAD